MKIAVGRSYKLRNGARVKIVNTRELTSGSARMTILVGYYDGTMQRCSWGMGGRYSSVDGAPDHPLDIVGRAR